MTTAIVPQTTYTALTFNGTEAVKFDATGITVGGNWGRRLAQVVTSQTGAVATGTTLIPNDDTIPQQTEGDQYLSLSITPTNASSTLEISVVLNVAHSAGAGGVRITGALFQDSTANAISVNSIFVPDVNQKQSVMFYSMSAGTTSSTTFKVRVGSNSAGTTSLNGVAGARLYGGVFNSSVTIKEYLP